MTRKKNSAALVAEFLDYCKRERGRTPTTVYKYGTQLNRLLAWCDGRHLTDLTTEELRQWVHEPCVRGARVGEPPSPSSVKGRTMLLRSLFTYLHGEGYVAANPTMRMHTPPVHNEAPKPPPVEAWTQLWGSDLSLSDRVAFGLGFFCGLRRSSVVTLQPHHVIDVPTPRLSGYYVKGRGNGGSVPWLSCVRLFAQRRPELIGGSAQTFIEPFNALRGERADKVLLLDWKDRINTRLSRAKFNIPVEVLDPQHFNDHLQRALVAADLPRDAFTPHQLRHGFGTYMLEMEVPLLSVSRLMGHSSVAVTQRYLFTKEDPLADLLDGGGEDSAVDLAEFSRFG
jgi:site-specific recombinase XerD